MTFLDAAYEVLKDAKAPLSYVEITTRALTKKILDTKGQTPEATMGSRLYVDTKRPNSRFKRVDRNSFELADVQSPTIGQNINAINQGVRTELHRRLMQMPPSRFEALIGELLLALGFEEDKLQVTTYSGDGGIDVRGVLNASGVTEMNAAVQVKRWKGSIQAPIVRDLRGSLTVREQGILITTSRFSKGAETEAQAPGKSRISLVDGEKLLDLLMLHKIGVSDEAYTVYSLDNDWWSGIASTPTSDGAVATTVSTNPDNSSGSSVAVTFPVSIQATAHRQVFYAELVDKAGRVRFDGKNYVSPSPAGKAATGWKSCNGWSLWRYQHPVSGEWRSIHELRT